MIRVQGADGQFLWQCVECGKGWLKKSKCSRHVETHMDGTAVKCPYCEVTYKNRHSLMTHMQVHKNAPSQFIDSSLPAKTFL